MRGRTETKIHTQESSKEHKRHTHTHRDRHTPL